MRKFTKKMEVILLVIGKTKTTYVEEGCREYIKRLSRFCNFAIECIPDIKSGKALTESLQKQKEGSAILAKIQQSDYLVLLDERGKEFTSVEFASWTDRVMASGKRRVVFCVGGPYGFSDDVYSRADSKISLSKMTFNHEMVRLFFTEQLYRAFSILKGLPYHHE